MMLNLQKHKKIIFLISVFILLNLLFLIFYKDVWWDSAVYIGIGKYIYSLGNSGLWEESRPIVLPLILGLGWKLGFDEVIFARILSISFSAGVLLIAYLTASKIFNKKTGLLCAFFIAFSLTFFFFSANILTEIPSLFFALLALYFLLEKRHFTSGIFAGLCVMTRFFHLILLAGIYAVFLFHNRKKIGILNNILRIAAGFLIPLLAFLILNQVLYSNAIYPFTLQQHLTRTTGWMHAHGFSYYFVKLLRENFLLLAVFLLPFFYKKDFGFNAIILSTASYLTVFSLIAHKEPRFMIAVLPFIYMLLAHCIIQIYSRFRRKSAYCVIVILIIAWVFLTFSHIEAAVKNQYSKQSDSLQYFQREINNFEDVSITNPIYALNYDGKIRGIIYYPKSGLMQNNIGGINATIFFGSCDMLCPDDYIDPACKLNLKKIHDSLNEFDVFYSSKEEGCEYKILIS